MPATDDCFLYLDGQRWPCHDGDVIGRAGTVAREALQPIEVLSRRHLLVGHRGGQWQLTALPEARNETFLDDSPMVRGQAYPLVRLQSLRVDNFECHLGIASGLDTQFHASPPISLSATGGPGAAMAGMPASPASPADLGPTVNDLPVAALETDARLAVLAANPAALDLLGSPALGRDLDEWAVEPTRLRSCLLGLDPGTKMPGLDTVLRTPTGARRVEMQATRFDNGLLILLRDLTDDFSRRDHLTTATARLSRQIEVLAQLSLAPAFAKGDLAQGFTLLTPRAADALGCRRVSVWLRPDGPAATDGRIVRHACHDTVASAPGGESTDMAYCPRFFDALASANPSAEAQAGSPMLNLLQEIHFVPGETRALLCIGLRQESGLYGVLAFERTDEAPWTVEDRQFAFCLASHAVLALGTRERREAMEKLQHSGEQMTAELEEANRYVQRILPEPISHGPITAEWHLQPSEALGGDSFGYHWVGDLFVMYILDVVGHGTGMALLSISVLNNVRARLLMGETAMADPAGVLGALNTAFPMENQNNMLFSMWYGVFDRRTRLLTYASAGHPPALLLHGDTAGDDSSPDYATLGTEGPSVGAMEGVVFTTNAIHVSRGSKLFIYTDGAFEIPVGPDREWTFEEFIAVVRSTRFMPGGETAYLRKRIGSLCAQPHFPDDFTIVRVSFED